MRFRRIVQAAAVFACLNVAFATRAQNTDAAPHANEHAAEPAQQPPVAEDAKPKAQSDAAEFTPPFPQRDEIFQPPNHKGLTKAQREEVRTEVVLKGFVNVDGTKALLSVNGKVSAMSVGDTQ